MGELQESAASEIEMNKNTPLSPPPQILIIHNSYLSEWGQISPKENTCDRCHQTVISLQQRLRFGLGMPELHKCRKQQKNEGSSRMKENLAFLECAKQNGMRTGILK